MIGRDVSRERLRAAAKSSPIRPSKAGIAPSLAERSIALAAHRALHAGPQLDVRLRGREVDADDTVQHRLAHRLAAELEEQCQCRIGPDRWVDPTQAFGNLALGT